MLIANLYPSMLSGRHQEGNYLRHRAGDAGHVVPLRQMARSSRTMTSPTLTDMAARGLMAETTSRSSA
jgi:hypothetical protein